jgi:hypothetical protein
METFKIRIKYKDLIIKIENLEIKFKIAWKPKFKISLFKKIRVGNCNGLIKEKRQKENAITPTAPRALVFYYFNISVDFFFSFFRS